MLVSGCRCWGAPSRWRARAARPADSICACPPSAPCLPKGWPCSGGALGVPSCSPCLCRSLLPRTYCPLAWSRPQPRPPPRCAGHHASGRHLAHEHARPRGGQLDVARGRRRRVAPAGRRAGHAAGVDPGVRPCATWRHPRAAVRAGWSRWHRLLPLRAASALAQPAHIAGNCGNLSRFVRAASALHQ